MKKSSSLHLEEDIWKEIDEYKDKYNLSSRNVAIERMLIERRMLLMMCNRPVSNSVDSYNVNLELDNEGNDRVEIEDSRITDELKGTINNSFYNMPD